MAEMPTSKNQTPARPKYGYTGRYTNPPFCCPIDGWMVGDREVDRETALKAFERYADALEKQLSAATRGLGAVIEAERRSGHETFTNAPEVSDENSPKA